MGISLGLVGLGSFGSAFADLFRSHPLVDRIALCDREPERIEKFAKQPTWQDKFDPKDAYDSLDEICKSDLDALVIITQPWLHAPQAIQALESGKHVYSAVPISSIPDGDEILDWCDKLVETVKRTGKHYMLGETTHYHADTMFCRRQAAEGGFGQFVHAEGEYFHDVEASCNLHDVRRSRLASKAGQEWLTIEKGYRERGVPNGPMHYPTHSTSGPISVMDAHAVKVCCWGMRAPADDDFFKPYSFANEIALFQMSNGATMRIGECRKICAGGEVFRIYGTRGSYREHTWITGKTVDGRFVNASVHQSLTDEEMRDPLPPEVQAAFKKVYGDDDPDTDFQPRGHGGSHPYLAHEFVDAVAHDRVPAINIWEACRYMAPGVMAHKSAMRDGEVLDVPDWGDAPGA